MGRGTRKLYNFGEMMDADWTISRDITASQVVMEYT